MTSPMKDSGVDWIGKIPEEWGICRVSCCFYRKNSKTHQKDPVVLSLARDGIKIRDISTNEGQLAADYTDYNPVDPDDILINPMDLVSGDNCSISNVHGVISPAYINLRYHETADPHFYHYYFKTQYWLGVFFSYGKGVSFDNRWTLSYSTLNKLPIAYPPLSEQKRIAAFLDKTCNEIDKLSTDIQSQIDKLAEYKKSIITHAVTKGLDPSAQMKDSGVDWIGKMPEEWNHVPLKYLIHKRISGSWGKDPRQNSNDMLCMRIADFEYCKIAFKNKPVDDFTVRNYTQSEIKLKTLHRDDILIEKSGGGEKTPVGRAVVYRLNHKALFANFMECLRFNKLLVDVEYIKYVLFTAYNAGETSLFITQTTGIQNINTTRFLSKTHSPLPPLNEQKQIADYLDNKCSNIDDVIEIKKKQLDKLAEYKKSIIYEYTTGKKRIKE